MVGKLGLVLGGAFALAVLEDRVLHLVKQERTTLQQNSQSASEWEIPDYTILNPNFMRPLHQDVISKELSRRIDAETSLYASPSSLWEVTGEVKERTDGIVSGAMIVGGMDKLDIGLYVRDYIIETGNGQVMAVAKFPFHEKQFRTENFPPHLFDIGDRVYLKFSGQFKGNTQTKYFVDDRGRTTPMMEIGMYKVLSK